MTERQKLEKLEELIEKLEEQKEEAYKQYKKLIRETNAACEDARKSNKPSCWKDFNTKRRRRNSARDAYEALEAKYDKYVKRYEKKRESLQLAVDAANLALEGFASWYAGRLRIENTKIVPREDGKMDVFFGGEHKAGDGEGHGHAVVDSDGRVVYLRDTWQDHDRALIDDARKGKD